MKKEKAGTSLTVAQGVRALGSRIADVVPSGVDPVRFHRVAMFVISRQDLAECNPLSVVAAVMDCARLGLEPGREAHFVRFKKDVGDERISVCQLLIDYRGYQRLARLSGAVSVIEARCVYEGDEFEWSEGTNPEIIHRPALGAPRGDENVVAFYTVARMTDGTTSFLVMTPEQVERIRAKSRAKDKGPWVTDWQAMGKKTAVKQLCDKTLPTADERLAAAIELDNRYETGSVTRPLPSDDTDEAARLTAERTRENVEDMKRRMREDDEIRREDAALATQ